MKRRLYKPEIQIKQMKNGGYPDWRWTLRGLNGQIIAMSPRKASKDTCYKNLIKVLRIIDQNKKLPLKIYKSYFELDGYGLSKKFKLLEKTSLKLGGD